MKPLIGLVVAMSSEARSILGWRRWHPTNGWKIQHTLIGHGGELLCVCPGGGIENAGLSAKWLVDRGVNGLAVMGISGGLNPMLRAGDLIIADTIIEWKNEKALCSWNTDPHFAHLIRSTLINEGLSLHRGTIITCRNPVLTRESKVSLFRQNGSCAVDMESAGVARIAQAQNLPLFAMRAICDTATYTVPQILYDVFDPGSRSLLPLALNALLQTPMYATDLFRLGKSFYRALAALKRGWRIQKSHDLIAHLSLRQHFNKASSK